MTVEKLQSRITMDTAADAVIGSMRIVGINWTGAANTNTLLVDDTAGKEIVGAVAETGNLDRYWYFGEQGLLVEGITLTTIGGGRITIYTR